MIREEILEEMNRIEKMCENDDYLKMIHHLDLELLSRRLIEMEEGEVVVK